MSEIPKKDFLKKNKKSSKPSGAGGSKNQGKQKGYIVPPKRQPIVFGIKDLKQVFTSKAMYLEWKAAQYKKELSHAIKNFFRLNKLKFKKLDKKTFGTLVGEARYQSSLRIRDMLIKKKVPIRTLVPIGAQTYASVLKGTQPKKTSPDVEVLKNRITKLESDYADLLEHNKKLCFQVDFYRHACTKSNTDGTRVCVSKKNVSGTDIGAGFWIVSDKEPEFFATSRGERGTANTWLISDFIANLPVLGESSVDEKKIDG